MGKRFVAGLVFAMSVAQGHTPGAIGKLTVMAGNSLIIDAHVNIRSVSAANDELIEAVAVNSREFLINGKKPGATTVVVEQQDGNRLVYDVTVRARPGWSRTRGILVYLGFFGWVLYTSLGARGIRRAVGIAFSVLGIVFSTMVAMREIWWIIERGH